MANTEQPQFANVFNSESPPDREGSNSHHFAHTDEWGQFSAYYTFPFHPSLSRTLSTYTTTHLFVFFLNENGLSPVAKMPIRDLTNYLNNRRLQNPTLPLPKAQGQHLRNALVPRRPRGAQPRRRRGVPQGTLETLVH
jgi:hypothetical protein